jgi:hypothetical protein
MRTLNAWLHEHESFGGVHLLLGLAHMNARRITGHLNAEEEVHGA